MKPFYAQRARIIARRRADDELATKGTEIERRPEDAAAAARRKTNARALAKAGIRVDPSRAPRRGR
jgi:hypothetical protein